MSLALATVTPGEPEIFAALQGEGASAGRPCVFVRLSRCNLACVWCDTSYTWRFEGDAHNDPRPHNDDIAYDRAANQLVMDEADVAARIIALGGNRPNLRLVITGGEPLLQAPALARLIALLPGWHIEVETNGTAAPPPALSVHQWPVHQWNVSPKLAHSGNARDLAIRAEALAAFAALPHAFFKFVIAERGDVDEVLALAQRFAIPPARIFLMPEGRDSETLRRREKWLADICLAHGFALSDRLHIHLFGDTRGT